MPVEDLSMIVSLSSLPLLKICADPRKRKTTGDEGTLIPYKKDVEVSTADISARLERLLSSFPEDNPSGVGALEDDKTVVGMPVIPDYIPDSELLPPPETEGYNQELIPTLHPDFYTYPLDLSEKPAPGESPFGTEDAQRGEALVGSASLNDIEMHLHDHYESDDYWKQFLTRAPQES